MKEKMAKEEQERSQQNQITPTNGADEINVEAPAIERQPSRMSERKKAPTNYLTFHKEGKE